MRNLTMGLATGAALAAALLTAWPLSANAAPQGGCFLSKDWRGWKSPDPKVIYLRVGISDVFRLDLQSGSDQLDRPDMHLVNKLRGSPWICSPLDLELTLSDSHGSYREPLFVKSITRLTPDEIRAIPAKYLP